MKVFFFSLRGSFFVATGYESIPHNLYDTNEVESTRPECHQQLKTNMQMCWKLQHP